MTTENPHPAPTDARAGVLTAEQMAPDDYQLCRIALLHAISKRAGELGDEIYDEARDAIDTLTAQLRAAKERERAAIEEVAMLRDLMNEWEYQDSTRSVQYRDDLCERWLAALAPTEAAAGAAMGGAH